MNTQDHMLKCYEQIGDLTTQMVEAARRADWNGLVDRERACGLLIQELRAVGDPDVALDAAGRRRRLEIMRRIVADDARIREFTEPWITEVESLLRGAGKAARSRH